MSKHYYGIDDFLSYQPVKPGRTLVVGSKVYDTKKQDRRKLYKDAIGVDMQYGDGVDVVHDMEKPLPNKFGKFDHIDCVSVMEHCQRPWLMAENILRVMNPLASLLLSVPFVWRVHGYPSDYWRFTLESFDILFPGIHWEKRGYLMEDVFRKLTHPLEKNGKKYLQRSEAIGFGFLVSR